MGQGTRRGWAVIEAGAALLMMVACGGSVAEDGRAEVGSAMPSDLIPGVRMTYRTFKDAAANGRCEPGESLVGAFCGPGASPVLAETDRGTVARCAAGPFTVVCVR